VSECESVRGEWGEICPDCGKRLPKPLPWGHGRPCSRSSLDRGHGLDGREMPAHSAAEMARWQTSRRRPNAFGGALGR
jgi:hypothetical protein